MQNLLNRRVGADTWSLWTALRIHVSLTKPIRMVDFDDRSYRIVAFNALLTPPNLRSAGSAVAAALAVNDAMKVYSTVDGVVFHPEDEEGREVVDEDGDPTYGQKVYKVGPHQYIAVSADMIASVMADPDWTVIVAAKNGEIVASWAEKSGPTMCDSITAEHLLACTIHGDATDRNAEPEELRLIRDELHRQVDGLAGADPAPSTKDLCRAMHAAIAAAFDPKAQQPSLTFTPHPGS